LHDALRPDRTGQVFQRVLSNIDSRLVLASLQQVERYVFQAIVAVAARNRRGLVNRFAEQRIKAAA
jgi:hypothetical protein